MDSLKELLNGFKNSSIAVIGDICLDLYYFLSEQKSEISVETGLETQSVRAFKHEAGGAGNVAINLKTLGAQRVDLYGVIGKDYFGEILRDVLEQAGVSSAHLQVQEEDWHSHVYHKIYKGSKEEPRRDIGNFNVVSNDTVQRLLEDIEKNIPEYHAIIINEQVLYGYHNDLFQKGLSGLIEQYEDQCLWICDSRHLNHVYNRSIRKLNIHEAQAMYVQENGTSVPLPDTENLALWLSRFWEKALVITLGEEGAVAVDFLGEIRKVPGISLIGPKDTVGAGDAFLAGMALSLSAGNSMDQALYIGNCSASVSVTKLYETGHPEVGEVLSMGESPDYRYNPETAFDTRRAVYLRDSPIELLGIESNYMPKVAIFDHDGTLSTLRQGWEPIMKEVCVSSILGASGNQVDRDSLTLIEQAAEDMIEKTTGIQTIIQMHHLQKLVSSFPYVPADEVLSPEEYKTIYNRKLLEMVHYRIMLFNNKMLDLSDLTIKGAIPFLRALNKAGAILYLASGTDQEDVRREAKILGYADLFTGGIYGSVGDINCDPKRMVIRNIIRGLPEGIKPQECYVFGDGPVEMREAAKKNLTRIGMVSDEKQRFGVNPNKRRRLILGGAQALLPDFSWIGHLADALNWEMDISACGKRGK